jgi:two-component system, cell cycle sensor histidine kinase and response regulator CckA
MSTSNLRVSELEERVRALELQLEQAGQRELATLLALGAVHDTNNLLAVVRSALKEWVGDEGAAAREGASSAVERAIGLMRDVLRLVKGRQASTSVDPNDVVLQVVPLARLFGDGRTRIDVCLRGALPRLTIDELDLERVLLNLLANAVQASPGGSAVRLETAQLARPDDPRSFVVITVADQGTGMSGEVRRRALEPMYSSRAGGTGLGLALVRLMVARYHGLLELESTPGQGTTVRVWLPSPAAGVL